MSNAIKLGERPDGTAGRDAVHVPVVAVVAGEDLAPGWPVEISIDGTAMLASGPDVGVVDPFVNEKVINEGELFWMLVNPQGVESVRHEWEHPRIPSQKKAAPIRHLHDDDDRFCYQDC